MRRKGFSQNRNVIRNTRRWLGLDPPPPPPPPEPIPIHRHVWTDWVQYSIMGFLKCQGCGRIKPYDVLR